MRRRDCALTRVSQRGEPFLTPGPTIGLWFSRPQRWLAACETQERFSSTRLCLALMKKVKRLAYDAPQYPTAEGTFALKAWRIVRCLKPAVLYCRFGHFGVSQYQAGSVFKRVAASREPLVELFQLVSRGLWFEEDIGRRRGRHCELP